MVLGKPSVEGLGAGVPLGGVLGEHLGVGLGAGLGLVFGLGLLGLDVVLDELTGGGLVVSLVCLGPVLGLGLGMVLVLVLVPGKSEFN